MTLILILTTWSLFALMEPVYCSPKANTAEFTRLLACHGALSCSRFVNTSNCFTRWVGILSPTSHGESNWSIDLMLRQADNIRRSILTYSYSLNEIWELREVLEQCLWIGKFPPSKQRAKHSKRAPRLLTQHQPAARHFFSKDRLPWNKQREWKQLKHTVLATFLSA